MSYTIRNKAFKVIKIDIAVDSWLFVVIGTEPILDILENADNIEVKGKHMRMYKTYLIV